MPAVRQPARPAPLALLLAALLCGCVATTPGQVRTTEPERVVAPATPGPQQERDGDPAPVERYGIAEAGPEDSPPTHRPHGRTHRPRPRASPAAPHHFPRHIRRPRPARHHAWRPRHPRKRPARTPGICALAIHYGHWPAGGRQDRACRRLYG